MYFQGQILEGIHNCTKGTNHIQPRSHGRADLYQSVLLIVNYVFTVFEKHSCHGAPMYPRAYGYTLVSKALLSVLTLNSKKGRAVML